MAAVEKPRAIVTSYEVLRRRDRASLPVADDAIASDDDAHLMQAPLP